LLHASFCLRWIIITWAQNTCRTVFSTICLLHTHPVKHGNFLHTTRIMKITRILNVANFLLFSIYFFKLALYFHLIIYQLPMKLTDRILWHWSCRRNEGNKGVFLKLFKNKIRLFYSLNSPVVPHVVHFLDSNYAIEILSIFDFWNVSHFFTWTNNSWQWMN
jgi:hypothetical protein